MSPRADRLIALMTWLTASTLCAPALASTLCPPGLARENCYDRPENMASWATDTMRSLFGSNSFGQSYALVIGIGDYDYYRKLDAPVADAGRVWSFLQQAGFDHMVKLTDGDATSERIEQLMLEEFPKKVGANDRFLFYFSGHGATETLAGGDQAGYLVLKSSKKEAWSQMLDMQRLDRYAQHLDGARHVLFVLDACFSGLAAMQRKDDPSPWGNPTEKLARLAQPAHHIVTAGVAGEESYSQANQSFFTTGFLLAAQGRIHPPADGILSLSEIMDGVNDYLDSKRAQIGHRFKMSPHIYDTRVEDNGGQFFFLKPGPASPEPPPPRIAELPVAKGGDRDAFPCQQISDGDYKKICESANGGDAAGQAVLGLMLEHGSGVAKDEAEAVRWYRKAAGQGDARGQKYLGFMLEIGRGVAKDEVEAVRWYRKAADQGDTDGQTNLGDMLRDGRGVTQDATAAVRWFRKAAEQGNASAQTNLGFVLERGRGVAKDEAEAVRWYRKAAEQGDEAGQNNLGVMLESGRGVARDEAEAVRWYRKAAEQGNQEAIDNLKRLGK